MPFNPNNFNVLYQKIGLNPCFKPLAEFQVFRNSHNSNYFTTYAGQAMCSNLGFASKVPCTHRFLCFRDLALKRFYGKSIGCPMINFPSKKISFFPSSHESPSPTSSNLPNQNDTVYDWHVDESSHVCPKSQFPGKQNNRTGGQGHAMPMLWKATGNDWWVSHVVMSLRLLTGTKAVFVSIQAYRFREETTSGKSQRLTLLHIIHKT